MSCPHHANMADSPHLHLVLCSLVPPATSLQVETRARQSQRAPKASASTYPRCRFAVSSGRAQCRRRATRYRSAAIRTLAHHRPSRRSESNYEQGRSVFSAVRARFGKILHSKSRAAIHLSTHGFARSDLHMFNLEQSPRFLDFLFISGW